MSIEGEETFSFLKQKFKNNIRIVSRKRNFFITKVFYKRYDAPPRRFELWEFEPKHTVYGIEGLTADGGKVPDGYENKDYYPQYICWHYTLEEAKADMNRRIIRNEDNTGEDNE